MTEVDLFFNFKDWNYKPYFRYIESGFNLVIESNCVMSNFASDLK